MYEGRPLTVRPAAARGTGPLSEEDIENDMVTASNPSSTQTRNNKETKPQICKFDSMPGGCKFGNRCKFSHSMSDWSGSGVEVKTEKKKETSKNKSSNKTNNEMTKVEIAVVPKAAKLVTEERCTFLMDKINESSEPNPSQLGMFLKSVVTLLKNAIQDNRAKFNMESIGWNYELNASSIHATSPPSIKKVIYWLKNPLFLPPPEVSLEEFNARSNSSQISTLLSEYGACDPDWQEKEQGTKK